jgi:hypothetical protein
MYGENQAGNHKREYGELNGPNSLLSKTFGIIGNEWAKWAKILFVLKLGDKWNKAKHKRGENYSGKNKLLWKLFTGKYRKK